MDKQYGDINMLYVVPDYYKEFQCTADRCEDTCCAGWQIVVDERALRKYIDWYNNKRLKLGLKGMSPAQYRAHYYRELNN